MPYNTRRKSLSLPSLGIHVPVTHAARAAAAAAARASLSPKEGATATATTTTTITTSTTASHRRQASSSARALSPVSMASAVSSSSDHPGKKLKRAHSDAHPAEPAPKRRDSAANKFDHTPPPSPPADRLSVDVDDADDNDNATRAATIDMDAIKDDIVEAVIVQLRDTGNRPHLVKDLAAVLMQQLRIVQQSANPCAIISSRLATFLKRPCWTAQTPCPLAKELETMHPRRTYFYLTTCDHQPLPDPAQATALGQRALTRVIITPSLSSADSEEQRRELSPSPEIDLSSSELDGDADDLGMGMSSTPIGALASKPGPFGTPQFKGHLPRPLPPRHQSPGGRGGSEVRQNHRAGSPPLEKDEKEFTQTADGLQKRKLNGDLWSAAAPPPPAVPSRGMDTDPDLFLADKASITTTVTTTTSTTTTTTIVGPIALATSPAMKPSPLSGGRRDACDETWIPLDGIQGWDCNPETMELDELDRLLNDL